MAETVLIRGGGGWVLPHDLPLSKDLAAKAESGEITILGPCDADGNLIDVTPEPEPEPEPKPKLRMSRKTQDQAGQSPDDDGPKE